MTVVVRKESPIMMGGIERSRGGKESTGKKELLRGQEALYELRGTYYSSASTMGKILAKDVNVKVNAGVDGYRKVFR